MGSAHCGTDVIGPVGEYLAGVKPVPRLPLGAQLVFHRSFSHRGDLLIHSHAVSFRGTALPFQILSTELIIVQCRGETKTVQAYLCVRA